MNEDEYRSIHRDVNHQPCVFEKIMLLGYGNCPSSNKILLAERETIACKNKQNQEKCQVVLNTVRRNARFALGITQAKEKLPHSKELKVQAGGLFGLQQLVKGDLSIEIRDLLNEKSRYEENDKRPIENIEQTVNQAFTKFNKIQDFPFAELVKTIKLFNQLSQRRRNKNSKQ